MQFTEAIFGIFFAMVFALYWFALRKTVRLQNVLLLGASYLFYGWWDWRFLSLIIATTLSTYFSALFSQSKYGKIITAANIVLNLGLLLFFKYFNFFSENLQRLFGLFGWNLDWFTLDVLLPVGISFYTFQAISYSVDAYKKEITPCRDLLSFATFIAYFPQLVAGPIERASHLLPQITHARRWDTSYAVSGLRMVLFGVMKKVCVADMLAIYADRIYGGNLMAPGMALLGGILFSLEIYFDFSAYCEIGRGVSRLLGIELSANFRFPYFSRNIVEFWRRWHISLMLWFRNYVYIPLGGNRKGETRTMLNTMLIFTLSGLWHGAAWNFVIWGIYWALVYAIGRKMLHLKNIDRTITRRDLPSMIVTFGVVCFGFYIFRCSTMAQIMAGLVNLWTYAAAFLLLWVAALVLSRKAWLRITVLVIMGVGIVAGLVLLLPSPILLLKVWWLLPLGLIAGVEWSNRNYDYPLERVCKSRGTRLVFYWACIMLVILSEPTDMSFIYFQF